MFSAIRANSNVSQTLLKRGFATTRPAPSSMSRLTLIGNLVKEPETRLTRNEKEYCVYTVATTNMRGPPNQDGERAPPTSTFHRITSFNDTTNKYLRNLKKGSKVYVEAAFELKDPEPNADPSTPQGQRQIFLRHEMLRVVYHKPEPKEHSEEAEDSSYTSGF